MKQRVVLALGGVVFVLLVAARAQVITGTISGVVKDTTGAVLPGTTIVILHEDTGVSRTVQSDASGRYQAPSLSLGKYRVTASLPGFQTAVRTGIVLTVDRQAVVNFDLAVGAIEQSVQVTGEAPLVDTMKGSMGEVVESHTITELPLNGRDLAQLITLQSGTLNYTGSRRIGEGGKQMVINGSRPTTNVFLMDGVAIETYNQKTPAGNSGQFLGVDAIREFKVETNAYSAEFGRGSGGQINLVTKSGTNGFHGTAFEFLRNDNLDAAQWEDNAFADGVKPEFKRNQFGGSLGGPLVRNKTFFFGTYEGLRERLGQTIVSQTFGDAIRGNPAAFGLPAIDPKVAPFLSLYPLPNGRLLADGTGDFSFGFSQPTREDFFQLRADHQLSSNHSLFGRYSFTDSAQEMPGEFPQFTVPESVRNQFLTLSETSIFSPTFLNTFRFGFTRTNPFEGAGENPAVDPALRFIPTVEQVGSIDVSGVGGVGNGVTGDGRTMNSFQWVDDAVWTKGAHTVKFGLTWNRLQFNGFNPARDAGDYRFPSISDFFRGTPDRFRGAIAVGFNDPSRSVRENIIGLYFQDDYRLTPRLTVNLGLRYEFITVPVENHGRIGTFPGTQDQILKASISDIRLGNPWFSNPSRRNFEPRVGFAWDVFGDGKTAVRGGFGIFHLQFNQTWIRTAAFRLPPFLIEIQATRNVPFPNIFQLCGNDNPFNPQNPNCNSARPAPDFVPSDFGTPYVMQYNFNIQRQLPGQMVLTAGYAGSRGVSLPAVADLNQPFTDTVDGQIGFSRATIQAGRPNRNFDDLRFRYPGASSFYNSFQLGLKRNFSQGLQMGAAYTVSKSIDDTSGNQTAGDTDTGTNWVTLFRNISLYRGLSSFDVRQVFSFNGTYELPIGPGKKFGSGLSGVAEKALAGWQLGSIVSLRSGLPGTVSQSSRLSSLGIRNDFPDLLAFDRDPTEGVSPGCSFSRGSVAAGTKLGGPEVFFDPCAFAPPKGDGRTQDTALGNLGRNTISLPGLATVDLTLTKNTLLAEKLNLQFRFEAFNLFNRVNFFAPALGLFDNRGRLQANAARITDTDTTARQLQFGLKLIF